MSRKLNSQLERARKKVIKEIRGLEKSFDVANTSALTDILDEIKGDGYKYSKSLDRQIRKALKTSRKDTELLASKSEKETLEISVVSMKGTNTLVGAVTTKKSVINVAKHVKKPRLSTELHSTNLETHNLIYSQLKRSIKAGEGVVKLANRLIEVDPARAKIPNYIREIETAARRAYTSPSEYARFKGVMRKHKKYIDNLTRAGEPGFEHLGIRGAGQAFLRDIEKATVDNIDRVVNEWARKKALNAQKVVARTETNNAFHNYNFEYAYQADHIIGVEIYLSGSHPSADVCNENVGTFLFAEHGRDINLPSFHPNCICGFRYIFAEGIIRKAA